METLLISPKETQFIAKLLQKGQLVALPTDTVYGLGCIANNPQAINQLRIAKKRPDEKAFAYVVNSIENRSSLSAFTQRQKAHRK